MKPRPSDIRLKQNSAYLLVIYTIIVLSAIVSGNCKSVANSVKEVTYEEYAGYDWQAKVEYFEKRKKTKPGADYLKEIYLDAFKSQRVPVTIAALQSMNLNMSERFRKELYSLLNHKHAMVRWESCKQIATYPIEGDLKYLMKSAQDPEWLVRECVYRTIRLYVLERNEKKYFYYVLRGIRDKNPSVIVQVYRTLHWYRDDRAFPYLLARSYHTTNSYELVVIIRELAKYNNRKVRNRLREISRSHPDFMVREEALKLLMQMYF